MKRLNIKERERNAIVQSLMAGVVPKIGLHHIQVGRKDEILAINNDLERIRNNGSSIRFIIGRFGTGKSFFLNLTKAIALEKKLVVMHADITTTRRLHSAGGQAQNLYTELLRNTSTKAKPNGGALQSIVEKWVGDLVERHGENFDVSSVLQKELKPLQNYVSGFDLATVLAKYYEAYQNGDDALLSHAMRWLLGEFDTKTEAKELLGARSIITDKDIYDYLKLWAAFVRLAGYGGLLVNIDEMGVLTQRLNNSISRNANYEVILQILNDCLQGNASGIGFIFAGTDMFLDDKRRGLMSYGALSSRLAANPFAQNGLKDYSGPVIRLENLSYEDLYLLLYKIRDVFACGDPDRYLVPDEAIGAFIERCNQTLGAEFYQTPRDTAKAFAHLLSLLQQYPYEKWQGLVQTIDIEEGEGEPFIEPTDDLENDAGEIDALSLFKI